MCSMCNMCACVVKQRYIKKNRINLNEFNYAIHVSILCVPMYVVFN